jgi:hypothetical protein
MVSEILAKAEIASEGQVLRVGRSFKWRGQLKLSSQYFHIVIVLILYKNLGSKYLNG